MSADNWAICPRCNRKAAHEIERRKKAVHLAYGKVPEEDFLLLLAKAGKSATEPEETLREDYSIKMQADGLFTVSYACTCQKCGFNFTYNLNQQVK